MEGFSQSFQFPAAAVRVKKKAHARARAPRATTRSQPRSRHNFRPMAPSASGDDRRLDRQECAHVGGLRARAKVGGLPGSQCARAAGEPRQCGRGAARKRRRTWTARGASGRALAGARGGAPPPEAGLRLGGGGVVPSPVGAFPPRGPRGGSPMGGAWARSACGLTKADPRRFGGVKSSRRQAPSGPCAAEARPCSAFRTRGAPWPASRKSPWRPCAPRPGCSRPCSTRPGERPRRGGHASRGTKRARRSPRGARK